MAVDIRSELQASVDAVFALECLSQQALLDAGDLHVCYWAVAVHTLATAAMERLDQLRISLNQSGVKA